MELPNIHFQDFPIEFKQIKKGDVSVKIEFEIGTKIQMDLLSLKVFTTSQKVDI